MSQRANLIKAKGLYTYINELNEPEGSLVQADNVNIDEYGVITQRRGFNDYGTAVPGSPTRIKQVFEYKDRLIRHYSNVLQFEDNETFQDFAGSYSELEEGFRIKFQESNGNMYFTTSDGIKKISSKSFADVPSTLIEDSGVPKATYLAAKTQFVSGGFLPPQSKVAYRILFGKKDNNGNLLLGSPSGRVVVTNTSKEVATKEQIDITISDYTLISDASDYFILYSTDQDHVVWFATNSSTTEIVETPDTVGKNKIRVDISGLTTNDQVALKIAGVLASEVTNFVAKVENATPNIVNITAVQEGDQTDTIYNGSGFDSAVNTQGITTPGSFANVDLDFIIPQGVDSTYFVQVFRTGFIESSEVIPLEDIDPGDEMNIVDEVAVSGVAGDIMSITDITPDSFRQSGEILYTNPITGGGITSANDLPPIAKDIELFRSHTFYANTKTRHQTEFNVLSVDDIDSNSSTLFLSDSDGSVEYVFVGEKEETDIDVDITTNTTENGYILIQSANSERSYYFWMDRNISPNDPGLANSIGIRVFLHLFPDTIQGTVDAIISAATAQTDFDVTDIGTGVKFKATNNGKVNTPATVNSLGGAWAINNIIPGDGEDLTTTPKQILKSGLASVAQSIDETARSIVSVINQDPDAPVSAIYLSGEGDLPGKILIESTSIKDDPFYISVSDSDLLTEFSPSLPLGLDATVSATGGIATFTTVDPHNFSEGDEIYITTEGSLTAIVNMYGLFTISNVTTFTFDVTVPVGVDTGTAVVWNPTFVSDNVESTNRVYYSKLSQPEAVPSLNFVDVGTKDGVIERIVSLRDSLFIFKTDGVYLLSGFQAPWNVRLLDNSTNIIAPDSAAIVSNQIYCLTTQGIASVTDSGVSIISRPIENLILDVTKPEFDFEHISFGLGYENDRSYMLWLPTSQNDTVATQCYRYNIFERSWTRWTISATCGAVKTLDDKMYIGAGDRNVLLKERKNRDRTDYSDRDFQLTIPLNSVTDSTAKVSSTNDVEIGDVIIQNQYITISQYTQFLRRLDNDNGLDFNDYEATYGISKGGNLAAKLTELNTELTNDDPTISTQVFLNSDWAAMQASFNAMIDELNVPGSSTIIKDYNKIERITPQEYLITDINFQTNVLTFKTDTVLLEGNVQCFKGIKTEIQWSPQHFGDPSGIKQVREGTVMFDQNNFCSASISFSSDLSPAFVTVPFNSKGVGFWGSGLWGSADLYWGGEGNDVPLRTIVPRLKQRCRYLNVKFKHVNARESWRIVGLSAVVRSISSRAYK